MSDENNNSQTNNSSQSDSSQDTEYRPPVESQRRRSGKGIPFKETKKVKPTKKKK